MQDLFLDVLGSTATKREAKAYLSRFGPQTQSKKPQPPIRKDFGVNLGNLYLPIKAVDEKPVFSHTLAQPRYIEEAGDSLHVALVKIRAAQSINDETLQGIGLTLSQLSQLGLGCVVVVDADNGQEEKNSAKVGIEQADRVVEAIDVYGGQGARRLDSVISVSSVNEQLLPSVKIRSGIRTTCRNQLLAPLRRGMIPVIAPVGFNSNTHKLVPVVADEVVLALTREFAGIQSNALAEDDPQQVAKTIPTLQKQISLDRVIVLDPLGGIPSTDRILGAHVFINLEQEFDIIRKDLLSAGSHYMQKTKSLKPFPRASDPSSAFTRSNPFSKFFAEESTAPIDDRQTQKNTAGADPGHSDMDYHVKNLELLRNTLALLPPSSSAFLTTPEAVANSQTRPPLASEGPRVRTRRQRNPLIHNLLTDKPVFSSSLPSNRSRNPAVSASLPVITSSPATFFKRGMPVGIVPDPLERVWAPPSHSNPSIDLSDPRIDLPRLSYLIEDSFNRKLDVPRYLARIKDRIAGVIIAGEYEGGAILTWETPPGLPKDDPDHMVPYLDKLAVLKRSQGAGGVADVVFKAMVRDCFPNGVCWRSRMDNPVNKWYFERAKGTWKMPGTNWTMFWTTEGVERGDGVFLDYQAVCKAVLPTWADKKGVVD